MSNYSSPHGHSSGGHRGQRPPVEEDTLKTEKLQVERKTFVLVLKENSRGRFLRVTEDVGGRRDSIIVPASGLEDFRKAVEDMARLATEIPPKLPDPTN